jgi:WD40 repeat protein
MIYKKEFEEKEIKYFNIIHPHSKEILSIDSNINLNILIDSSYDGYINLYTIPDLNIVRSIYNNPNKLIIEKVLLSSTPLPSFLTYSNEKEFKVYSINGKELYNEFIEDDFINPQIQTDEDFVDYLIYESNEINHNIVVRQFPYLGIVEINNNKTN